MSDKCSTVQQGYPSITQMKDCQLSHTGIGLLPFFLLAVLIVCMGIGMRVISNAGKARS